MELLNSIALILLLTVTATSAQSFRHEYTGDLTGAYCSTRGFLGCCANRRDDCSFPILGTLCYCDDFCNRTHNHDCCPDYWSFCKGIVIEPPEEIKSCRFEGNALGLGKEVKQNCNTCKCQNVGDKVEVLCEQNVCLIEPDISETINRLSGQYGWHANNYSQFWGRTLEEGIRLRLGTLKPDAFVLRMNPVRRIYDASTFPREFDSSEKWPGWISGIHDQQWCGSSWAISTAAVASDRFAILSKGREHIQLSAQHLVSCDVRGQQSCNGGYLDRAWSYIRRYGLVDEDCFPYTGTNKRCPIKRRANLIESGCQPPRFVDRQSRYKVAPAYRIGNETDIMYELLHSGPVQATIKVYHDFYVYNGGIYRHTDLSASQRTGYHSVRIVGWGEEYTSRGTEKYWKVANSWGPAWGENGYFRILRGSNECEIESFVLGTWPEIENKLLLNNEIQTS